MTNQELLCRLLAGGALTVACGTAPSTDPSTEPLAVNLVVTITTDGVDTDPDTYLLLIGADYQTHQVQPIVRIDLRFDAGTYDVGLDHLAPNCSVAGPDRVQVTLSESELTTVTFAVECHALTGHIRVTTTTTGGDRPAWYRATLTATGGSKSETMVPANNALTIANLNPDVYEVALSGLPPNCRMTGPAVQTATVTAGGLDYAVAPVDFAVECRATTGDLRLVATTIGVIPNQFGYRIELDGQVVLSYGDPILLPLNGSWLLRRLSPGSHTVELRRVPANCSVEGANPRTVTVTLGAVSEEQFRITCVAP
jgi:hypothetical protein